MKEMKAARGCPQVPRAAVLSCPTSKTQDLDLWRRSICGDLTLILNLNLNLKALLMDGYSYRPLPQSPWTRRQSCPFGPPRT